MKAKFTKGPWEAITCGHRIDIWSNEESITGGVTFKYPLPEDELTVIANHNLIAAAPDMYKMLLECFHSSNKGAWKDSLGELLAKARGE